MDSETLRHIGIRQGMELVRAQFILRAHDYGRNDNEIADFMVEDLWIVKCIIDNRQEYYIPDPPSEIKDI